MQRSSWNINKPPTGTLINQEIMNDFGLCFAAILNENGGFASYDLVNGTIGTFQGTLSATTWGMGILGQCITTNGTTGYINYGNCVGPVANLQKLTASFWLNWNGVTQGTCISKINSSGNQGWDIEVVSSQGLCYFQVNNTGNNTYFTIDVSSFFSQWVHIAFTWAGGITPATVLNGYVNGLSVTSTSTQAGSGSNGASTNDPLLIGYGNGAAQGFFPGSIDNVIISNRVLTKDQIFKFYTDPFFFMQSIPRKTYLLPATGASYSSILGLLGAGV